MVSEAWVEEFLANTVRGADTIIYRVGSDRNSVRRVSVPAEMPELVAEFLRRVVEASGPTAADD